jgi:hypothetical protein
VFVAVVGLDDSDMMSDKSISVVDSCSQDAASCSSLSCSPRQVLDREHFIGEMCCLVGLKIGIMRELGVPDRMYALVLANRITPTMTVVE